MFSLAGLEMPLERPIVILDYRLTAPLPHQLHHFKQHRSNTGDGTEGGAESPEFGGRERG
jgi:hypothetical protein